MRTRTAHFTLPAVIAVAVGLVVPGSASARGCAAEQHPIYSMTVQNGAGCQAGATVARRLAERFGAPSDFASDFSRHFIYQRDGRGRRWKCQWNSASAGDDVVSWNCARRKVQLVSWMWRAARA
jgi:hypothetical protein